MMGLLITLSACKDDDPPADLAIVSLTANDKDLNGATTPSDVPTDASIVATFSTDVDPATATDANITLVRDYDGAAVPKTITTTGNVVTVKPTTALNAGSLFKLSMSPAVLSTKGKALPQTDRTFTTAGFFEPTGQIAYWNFDDNTNDATGVFNASASLTKDVTYVDARKTAAGKAASFNGTSTIIEIPNGNQLMANKSFAISFWINTNSSKEGHFVLGLAGSKGFQFEILGGPWTATDKGVKLATQYDLGSTSDAEDTWWNGNPNGWQGSTFSKDVSTSGGIASYFKDKWAQVICMYNSTTKVGSMYVNGEKVREFDFNLWPAGDAKTGAVGVKYAGNPSGNNLAFGFIQGSANRTLTDSWADPSDPANNHFKGLMDDVRIFNKALTANEISLIYNSEKP